MLPCTSGCADFAAGTTALERAQLAGFLARVGLFQDPQPILGAETPAPSLGGHFGIRVPRSTAEAEAPVALRAPSTSAPAVMSIPRPTGIRFIHRTLPAPTLISLGRLSHRLLARGVAG